MKNPVNTGNKIIDAANVHAIKPIAADRALPIASEKLFTAEIRASGSSGALVEQFSVPQIVSAFKKVGEELTLLPTNEAIRMDWVTSIKEFTANGNGNGNGNGKRFNSVVEFKNPHNGHPSREWFAAKTSEIPGGNAPSLADLIKEESTPPSAPAKKTPAAKSQEPAGPK